MKFKGFHYDIARGAYLRPEYFKQSIERAADAGFTHFIPYLENMISLPSMSKACPQSAYSPEQWKDFERTAKACGIELVPHFNVVGHSLEICKAYPELGGTEQNTIEMDISLPETKNFVLECLRDYCSFSDSEYFLIGGDECQFPSHLLLDSDFNPACAFAEHINTVSDELSSLGRRPIMWHDMLIHYPEALELLSRDVIIAFWFYDEDSDYPLLEMLHKRGFKTIMASGICDIFSQRRSKAAEKELEAVEKYDCHGFMMTSWRDCRFEKQILNIKYTGELLAGKTIPDNFLEANSLQSILESNYGKSPDIFRETKKRLSTILDDDIWNCSPEHQVYRNATFGDDWGKILKSFLKYHYPEGKLFNELQKLNAQKPEEFQAKQKVEKPVKKRIKQEFGISVSHEFGTPELKINNGNESFLIYPEYGASIQAYQCNGIEIIPHSMPKFMSSKPPAPGGYRSYKKVLGFRPIWAFGSHHLPCIVWQGPFQWNIEQTSDLLKIELSREMYHVTVKYNVIVKKDSAGFGIELEACNKIEDAYGAFNFSLPLSLNNDDSALMTLESENTKINPVKSGDTFFVIPPTGELLIRKPDISLAITVDKNKTAGFYTEWRVSFISPDLRSKYQKLKKGQSYNTAWHFKPIY